ncbi:MAG: D-glycerate dehydrogenase [Acidobacteria bacterium]|nr:D-glycerate dehydrogenase [Acidobacteriota bacterium]
MKTPSVLVTRRLPAVALNRLREACDVDLYTGAAAMPREDLAARIEDKQGIVCLLTDRVDRDIIDRAPALRVIANVAVGYDNVDATYARERGIAVTNTPDVLTEAVAEFTWGLILALTRRIGEGERLLRRGEWRGWALDFMLGMELSGKRLGIVGAGRIGQAVARRAPAFGMHVVYTGRARQSDARPPMPEGSRRVSFDEVLVTSDVMSLHIPLTPETRHLMDQRAFARMKRTAYLVNTARGPIVDEAALAWALDERLIAGAALDVYEREPAVEPVLLQRENVVLAPHLGSATRETRTAMSDLAVDNVLAVLSGRPPLTPVT